jgi:molecular chaperone DnaK
MSDIVVGIDLGTTNSLIGAVVDGKATLFADAAGNELLPSVVGTDGAGALLVGRAAKNRRLLDPAGTVVSVKRLMGTNERRTVGGRPLTPSQVSALILGSLLDRAEAKLGQRPKRAVITVPAYFDDAQRQATRDAGEIAGLSVERLINEPTAAALTYHTGAEQLVLVYDLGGGTFDVSILERDEGLLEVRTSKGDTHLGGDDLDAALTRLVLERLGDKRGPVEKDPRAMTRLVEQVERAKMALSDREDVRLFDPFLTGEGADAIHLDLPLSRKELDAVARPFVERTLACIDAALRDTKLRPGALDRILLVGGVSKMPIVGDMVAAHLDRPVHRDLDADRAVALGASLLAGRIGGAEVSEVLIDITPHTLSVGVLGQEGFEPQDEGDLVAAPVIPRDTVVPAERKRIVYTHVENQRHAGLPIAQGEHSRLGGNTRLGEVVVGPLPPSPAQSPIEVTFKLDLSGVLHVSARHLASGKSAEVEIAHSPYRLTEQRRAQDRAEVEALRAIGAATDGAGGEEGEGEEVTATESELSLANAMLARARRARERGGEAEVLGRVDEAAKVLEAAVASKAPATAELTDELSDALLDLV